MGPARGRFLVGLVSFGVAASTLLPYVAAQVLPGEQETFSGFLLNPLDGFSYLAKMRQGLDGAWLFHLPYASDPGPGAAIYLYFLALGHLARLTGLPLVVIYHAARLLGALLMFLAAHAFLKWVIPDPRPRALAFGLTLVASGLGWTLLPLGLYTSDLWVPEIVPILAAYANAHFPLAVAAVLAAAVVIEQGGRSARGWGGALQAYLLGNAVAIVLPFAAIVPAAALALWTGWERLRAWRTGAGAAGMSTRAVRLATWLLGLAPWAVYQLWLVRTHPALSSWSQQNLTPSPPAWDYAASYGLVLALAVVGALAARPLDHEGGRLTLVWVVVNALLLFSPFGLQRRLALGLFVPLAGLAGMGLDRLARGRTRLLVPLVFLLSLPSTAIVIAAGLGGVRDAEPSLVLAPGEAEAYGWIDSQLPAGSLVLASPQSGNRLPAYADVRVLYGHPFETPDAEAQRRLVESLFARGGGSEGALFRLREVGVSHVLVGPSERALGDPAWLSELPIVYEAQTFEVHEVPAP